ncbi:alpha/beta hydrolase family protein [Streptococcus sp. H31]|uniref:alpha/beta hydrolase family protein n=1 Tax=Streptococcus huangxiaojuni TaxID=3237239 RepID=UPI0034A22B14
MTRKTIFITALIAGTVFLLAVFWIINNNQSPKDATNQTDETAREGYQFTNKTISFVSNDNTIYGRALIPQTDMPVPTIIVCHGFGGNYEQELTMQENLAASGIAVYAFDFAGGSGYDSGKSEGEMTDMSVLTEVQNLKDALVALENQEFFDKDNLYLLGGSQGGVVSSIAAAENPEAVKGLILLYPAFSLFDDAHNRFESAEAIPETYNLMGLTVGSRYFTDIWDYDIYDKISQYDGDVRIFHGTDDSLVPISYAERASEVFPHAVLTKLKGEGHGFSNSAQKEAAENIANFIKEAE